MSTHASGLDHRFEGSAEVASTGMQVRTSLSQLGYEVLAALVASLRRELADVLGALEETRGELTRAHN